MKLFLRKNQQGFAMLITVVLLSLGSSFALLAFRVSSTELAISRYSASESTAKYLAESGVEKVMSWASNPEASPAPDFFRNLLANQCLGTQDLPDFPIVDLSIFQSYLKSPTGPFAQLKNQGWISDLRLYAPSHPDGICTVEVSADTETGASTKLRVELTGNPLGAITAGIQGAGSTGSPVPVWVHWGGVRYTGQVNLGADILKPARWDGTVAPNSDLYRENTLGDPNVDPIMTLGVEGSIIAPTPDDVDTYALRPNISQNVSALALDDIDLDRLKSFIKKNGEYYTVAADGIQLQKNGGDIGTFDEVFSPQGQPQVHRLVWIENVGLPPLVIQGGEFEGYFYFSGHIQILGNVSGMLLDAITPQSTGGLTIPLSEINLDGLFHVQGHTEIQDRFTVYGAIYSKTGFTGAGATKLEVWYNADFAQSLYSGIRRLTPLAGTWMTLPTDS